MTYQQYGLIQATDYNNLVGTLNTVWGSGSGNTGYGQTNLPTVAVGEKVGATEWSNLINKISSIASHQNSTITSVTAPAAGDPVKFVNAINTNLSTIQTNRLNASAQATSVTTSKATTTTWLDKVTYTTTVTFTSGAAARYFFNAGGQLAITCSHGSSGSTGIDKVFYDLCTAFGTVTLSAGTARIGGTDFTGTTKTGGSGTVDVAYTISTATGYHALTTTPVEIFKQTATGALSKYVTSYISVTAKVDATGGVITFVTTIDENWSSGTGLTVSTGTTMNLTVKPPSTTYVTTNAWGTPTVVTSYV
jgi:hypothetical protein